LVGNFWFNFNFKPGYFDRGMFLLGVFYLLSTAVNKKPEKLQIYIENPDKIKKSKTQNS